MSTKATSPLKRVRVKCALPLWSRFIVVKRDNLTGELILVEVIWATRNRWRRWSEHHDTAAHGTIAIGPFVVAVGLN